MLRTAQKKHTALWSAFAVLLALLLPLCGHILPAMADSDTVTVLHANTWDMNVSGTEIVDVTVGERYTVRFLWKALGSGSPRFQLQTAENGTVNGQTNLFELDVPIDGVKYDRRDYTYYYTFTATAPQLRLQVYAMKASGQAIFYLGEPQIYASDENGDPVSGGTVYDFSDLTKWSLYEYSNPDYPSVVTVTTLDRSEFKQKTGAYLASLDVGYPLSPAFDAECAEYAVTVPSDVDRLDIQAVPEEGCTVDTVIGNENFAEGETKDVQITVRDTQGQTTTYTLHVTRELDNGRVLPQVAMRDGAAVRCIAPAGLRFEAEYRGLAELTASGATYHAGMLIVPTDTLGETAFTAAALDAAKASYRDIPQTVWAQEPTDGEPYHLLQTAVTGIAPQDYARAYAARAYLDVTYADGFTRRFYADFSQERNTRAVYYVAGQVQNDPQSAVSTDGLSTLGGFTALVEQNADRMAYLRFDAAARSLQVVQKYSDTEDLVMNVRPTGVNRIINIAPPQFIKNSDAAVSTALDRAYSRAGAENMSESDWLGPHYIGGNWYGGTHGTSGEGGTPTGLSDNVRLLVNGKSVDATQDLRQYAASVELLWDTYAGGETKSDALLVEHHSLRFDGTVWHVSTTIEFLAGVEWQAYYGMQCVYGVWNSTISYDGGTPQSIAENASGGNAHSTATDRKLCETMLLNKGSDYLRMYLDPYYGIGDRRYLSGNTGAFTATYNVSKNGKAYFGMVNGAQMRKGATVSFLGQYRFYSSDKFGTEVYDRSVLNEGDITRIANAMKKAKEGKPVTVGVIGGSITQGSKASSSATCYASLLKKWWESAFPNSDLTFINAGKGDTTSLMGAARVQEDLLQYDPDFVVVEFSVNDPDDQVYQESYEGLIRQILNAKSQPGLLLMMMMDQNGANREDLHLPIAQRYDLPVISYQQALWPKDGEKLYDWGTLSPDTIHPNDFGHAIAAKLITHRLEQIRMQCDTAAGEPAALPSALTENGFENVVRYHHDNSSLTSVGIFTETDGTFQFANGWTAVGSGDPLTLTVTNARRIYILYYQDASGNGGKASVRLDGKTVGKANGDFRGGWNRSEVLKVSDDAQALTGEHTITITPTSADGKAFTIMGIVVGY